ncbi:uncharacterized small protein [Microvirga lotononidis]|uniref:Uncharacterized small protein n=2 Tax=Microvirga lotononidis TaxID=864069 RepID=I4YZR7_9HYPH|nr:uncharacterized small protein [Microvirga lotononidis]
MPSGHNGPQFLWLLKAGAHPYIRTATRAKITGHEAGPLLGLYMFVSYILSKVRNYHLYRKTVRELAQLSDRDLADLGIARYDISRVAREATFA